MLNIIINNMTNNTPYCNVGCIFYAKKIAPQLCIVLVNIVVVQCIVRVG